MRFLVTLALLALTAPQALAQTEPSTLLWYRGNGGAPPGNLFQARINSYGTLVTESNWANVTLADHRAVVIGMPTLAFSADQIADLEAFVNDDAGILILAGDSNLAGLGQINTINNLLQALNGGEGYGMYLQDTNGQLPPLVAGMPENCTEIPVQRDSPFIRMSNPLFAEGLGHIAPLPPDADTGTVPNLTANPLSAVGIAIDGGATQNFQLATRNGRVLLTSDFDIWGVDACGLSQKEAMWDNVWNLWCDRDEDGATALACGGFDCDDIDPDVGNDFSWSDTDGDGDGDPNFPSPCIEPKSPFNTDCDDSNPDVSGAYGIEVCNNSIDDDCDTLIDGADDDIGDAMLVYTDLDGDGYGQSGTPTSVCVVGNNQSELDGDCDDGNPNVNPGETEDCNNTIDDNCDGEVNESSICVFPTDLPTPTDTQPPDGCGCTSQTAPIGLFGLLGVGLLPLLRRRNG